MNELTPLLAKVRDDEIERTARHHAERQIAHGLRPRPLWRRVR